MKRERNPRSRSRSTSRRKGQVIVHLFLEISAAVLSGLGKKFRRRRAQKTSLEISNYLPSSSFAIVASCMFEVPS